MDRLFTVDEANARLGSLRPALERIREARRALVSAGRRVRDRAVGDGGGEEGSRAWEAAQALRGELETLGAEGIILRDAETGLVDFPAEREGRRVFLCWRADEDRVAHWHDVDAGMAGRRPL